MANTKKVTLHEDEIVIRRPDLMHKLETAYKKGMETGETWSLVSKSEHLSSMMDELLDIATEENE